MKTHKAEIEQAKSIKNNNLMKSHKNITTFEEHLTKQYGKLGTEKRSEFETKAKSFIIGE